VLAFTSVYFFESRLFNGLRAIQIKKFPLPLRLASTGCAGVIRKPGALAIPSPGQARRRFIGQGESYNMEF
jgi:hypothetical protein